MTRICGDTHCNGRPFSNELSPAQVERLAILIEELGEAQKAAGKILRHGYDSHNPDNPNHGGNWADLNEELGDVRFAIALLAQANDVSERTIQERVRFKAAKIGPYLHHQPKWVKEIGS